MLAMFVALKSAIQLPRGKSFTQTAEQLVGLVQGKRNPHPPPPGLGGQEQGTVSAWFRQPDVRGEIRVKVSAKGERGNRM